MKNQQSFFLFILIFCSIGLTSQDRFRTFVIHEDVVKPSMAMEYEGIIKEFVAVCKKHNLPDIDFLTVSLSNFKYWYVSEIDNMAELDKRPLGQLHELEGDDVMNDIWTRMDMCYDRHGSYALQLDMELSYMPEGSVINDPDQLYRVFDMWYVTPQNLKKLEDVAMKFKELSVKQGSVMPYRVYRSGFGVVDQYFVVVTPAKNAIDFHERGMKNGEIMGPEMQTLSQQALAVTREWERLTGYMRPDLSQIPE